MKLKDLDNSALPRKRKTRTGEFSTIKNLDSILNIVRSINSHIILNDVLKEVLKHAIRITHSDRGFIVLIDDKGELNYEQGLDSSGKELSEMSFNISHSIVSNVYSTGHPKFVENAQDNRNVNSCASILDLQLETILCSPLITNGKKIGVIYVDSKNLHKINTREITDTFEILAGHAAIAIKNAQLFQGRVQAIEALQKINHELTIAKEKAEHTEKLKTAFLAQMSHEIRTPLNIIQNYAKMLLANFSEDQKISLKKDYNSLEKATKRITRTFDLMINNSEIQAGTYEATSENIELVSDILNPIVQSFEEEAAGKGLDFNFRTDLDSCIIRSDHYSTKVIFENLIDNAIKFTRDGGVDVLLEEKNNYFIVRIIDSGIGISEYYMPNLFKPFTQEYQGYSRKFDGNGLGLALVKNYCEINDFDIEICSQKKLGTEVKITIPAVNSTNDLF